MFTQKNTPDNCDLSGVINNAIGIPTKTLFHCNGLYGVRQYLYLSNLHPFHMFFLQIHHRDASCVTFLHQEDILLKESQLNNEPKYKRLTYEQRILIEDRLNKGASPHAIAGEIGKSHTTVIREVKSHSRKIKSKGNNCLEKQNCNRHGVCGKQDCKTRLCKNCKATCYRWCGDYVPAYCDRLEKSPHVCNACTHRGICNYERVVYMAKDAEKLAYEELHEKRAGFDLTLAEIDQIDRLISPRIKAGQSPYHIKQTLGEKLPISESTIRRLIESNELDARNIDLRDKVKRRPRKSSRNKYRNTFLAAAKLGHMYKDFLEYRRKNDAIYWQMDCVEGKKDENATLLTLHFPMAHMQLALIMQEHTSGCVIAALDKLETSLGKELFANVFQVILTDNGHEFTDIENMERSCFDNGLRTRIFFCEPNRSDEKAECETNHKLIRYVIPKGSSLEPFSQLHISLMMNHINSYKRKSILGKCPYDVARAMLPEDFFALLGLESVPAEEVNLTPDLLHNTKESA